MRFTYRKNLEYIEAFRLFGGAEGNRTPVRRRPYNDVYSLGCIGFNLEAGHSQTPKARPNAFSSETLGHRLPLIVLI